ncbi:MAG: ISNCY family transposase [Bryobacteraceae bacterium]
MRPLVRWLEREDDRGVVHALSGKPSNRKIGNRTEQRAITPVRRKYQDFGRTLAAECLAHDDGIVASRESLRRWMIGEGIWKSRWQRVEEVHAWRRRRSCFGELLHQDMLDHDWLEGRREKIYYIAMIDDATGRAFARFVRHDSRAKNLQLLWEYLARHGRPLEVYTDYDTVFAVSHGQAARAAREGWGEALKMQFGWALQEVPIDWIGARNLGVKEGVERRFQTAQDRSVKGMRLAGVKTLKAANRCLEQELLPQWNERFTVKPADAHRPLRAEHDLAAILCQVEQRVVTNDYTVRF